MVGARWWLSVKVREEKKKFRGRKKGNPTRFKKRNLEKREADIFLKIFFFLFKFWQRGQEEQSQWEAKDW